MDSALSTFTFVCLAADGVATSVDIQPLARDAIRSHAFRLLVEHASAVSIEIWRDDVLVDLVVRGAGPHGVTSAGATTRGAAYKGQLLG